MFRCSLMFSLPVLLISMCIPRALLSAQLLGFPLDELLKCALATPVQFWLGRRFHMGAWK